MRLFSKKTDKPKDRQTHFPTGLYLDTINDTGIYLIWFIARWAYQQSVDSKVFYLTNYTIVNALLRKFEWGKSCKETIEFVHSLK